MLSDEADRQPSHPTLIRTPDQLQQAKRPDAPAPAETADQRGQSRDTPPQRDGILGQFESERAHD